MPAPLSAAIRRAVVVTGLTAGLVVSTVSSASAVEAAAETTTAGSVQLSSAPSSAPHSAKDTSGRSGPAARPADGAWEPPCGDRRGGRLDGFTIGVVPAGTGPNVSDFEYTWEDVEFTSRVWESGPDPDGAYRVDLNIKVLRGERIGDLSALLDFLAYYHERDLDSWELADYDHPDGPGYVGAGEAFWLVEPGVAVSVRLAPDTFDAEALRRTADAVTALDG